MILPLKPQRGGFLRPFGCAEFIREYLLGKGLHGAPKIAPEVGAPQAEIFHHYKMALMRATAEDRATRTEEKRAQREKRKIKPDNIEKLIQVFLSRMTYKAHGCRYHSFVVYISNLQRLKWIEFTNKTETSEFQEHYHSGQPRKYFRITAAGRKASKKDWANPLRALYG